MANNKNPNQKQPGEKAPGKFHYNPGNQSGKTLRSAKMSPNVRPTKTRTKPSSATRSKALIMSLPEQARECINILTRRLDKDCRNSTPAHARAGSVGGENYDR
jgi:hypothetical protein